MTTLPADDNFITSLVDTLFSSRCRNALLSQKESLRVKKSLRLLCYELFFMFQRGPHKFLSGTYPRPSRYLFDTLVAQTTITLTGHETSATVSKFKSLIAKLADNEELISVVIFCILVSDLRQQKSVYGRVTIKKTATLGKENSFNPRFPFYYDADIFENRRDIAVRDLSRNQQKLFSILASGPWTKWTENACTKGLQLSVYPDNSNRQFFGAFTHLKVPSLDSGVNLYGSGSAVSLAIPVLSERTGGQIRSVGSIGTIRRRLEAALGKGDRLKDYDDDDEDYCGSATSLSYSRLALTDENALVFLRTVLSNLPSVIQDILSNAMFPRNFYGHGNEEVSTQATDISAGHSRFSWENRGVQTSMKEAPFLVESGPLSITVLQSLLNSRFRCPNTYPDHTQYSIKPDCLTFNQFQGHFAKELRQQFIRDLLLMRLGVQSRRFAWKLPSDSTEANSGPLPGYTAYLQGCFVYLGDHLDPQSLGISAGALCHCLATQLKAGTQFRHLKWLTTASSSHQSGDTIRQAFLSGLDTWLRAYEAGLQALLVSVDQALRTVQPTRQQVSSFSAAPASRELGILSVLLRLRTLTSHIDFIANHLCGLSVPSCHCRQPEHQHEAQGAGSSLHSTAATLVGQHGIGLLWHLCRQAEKVIADPLEATVRFLFKRACRPFILFLRRLLVDGVYQDGEEFNIVIAPKYLAKRNIAFWTKAFTFKISATDTNNPQATGFHGLLPEQFERDILRCAKSVCLLKSVAPKHFLFQCRRFFPSLDFPTDAHGVQSNSATLADYLRLVAESARSLEATRCQRLAKEEFNRKELVRRAAETRAKKLLLVQARNAHSSEARRTKQLALHAELTEAMDQAAETKRIAQETEKAFDRALQQEDASRRAHEESVLAEARLQLTSQYAKLIEQADMRRIAAEQQINGTCCPVVSGSKGIGAGGGGQWNADPGAVQPTGDNWRQQQQANRLIEENSHVDGDGGVGHVDAGDQPEAGGKEENVDGGREATDTFLLDDTGAPNLLRTSLRLVDVEASKPGDILCPSSDDHVLTAAEAHPGRHTKADDILPVVGDESACEAVARFRTRNRFGHASDATAQRMLYGPGSGPTCRPSAWAAGQEEYELKSRECVQPDAVTFYREALKESPCLVPPLTMALPDLSTLTHFEPSRRLPSLVLANVKQSPDEVSASDSTSKKSQKKEAVMEQHLPLQLLLGKIVLSPLSHYIKQVDSAIGDHMIYKLQLMQHLQCLQQLFLLQNGTFSQLLLNSGLFTESSPPVGHWQAGVGVQSTETTDYLHRLMQSVLAKLNAHSEERQSDEPVPTSMSQTCCLQLPRGTAVSLTVGNRSVTDSDESGVDVASNNPFTRLSLVYRAPWPVNLCLHPAVLAKYNRVFTHLVHVKFAVDRLASAYRLLRLRHQQQRRGKGTSHGSTAEAADSHQVSIWLFELLQVVTGIEAYIANQVASTGWVRLYNRLTSGDLSLETLCRDHEAYVDELLTSCLLTGCDPEIPGLLHSLLACAHRFHQLALVDVRHHPRAVGGGPAEAAHLEAVHSTFHRHAHFLRRRSTRLASSYSGAATGQLLGRLVDFAFGANDFYATGSLAGHPLPYY